MTISYPLNFPWTAPGTHTVEWTPENANAVSESPLALSQTVYDHTGERWRVRISFPTMDATTARDVIAFLCALNGAVGTFLYYDPLFKSPRGSAGGVPVVNGSSQTGKVLLSRGWTPSQAGVLKAGDFISVSNRLYVITQDSASDGSGNASLDIWPSIRQPAPADGTSIQTSSPKGLFRLAGPIAWTATRDLTVDSSLEAIEAL